MNQIIYWWLARSLWSTLLAWVIGLLRFSEILVDVLAIFLRLIRLCVSRAWFMNLRLLSLRTLLLLDLNGVSLTLSASFISYWNSVIFPVCMAFMTRWVITVWTLGAVTKILKVRQHSVNRNGALCVSLNFLKLVVGLNQNDNLYHWLLHYCS